MVRCSVIVVEVVPAALRSVAMFGSSSLKRGRNPGKRKCPVCSPMSEEKISTKTHPFENQKQKGGAPRRKKQSQNRFGKLGLCHLGARPIDPRAP